MNLNFTSPVHPVSAPRPTSFFIEDILLHKPKPLREVPPEHFPGPLASRVPLLDYGYPLMPAPTLLAPHPHPALHKPEHHHHPYFLTASGKRSPSRGGAGGEPAAPQAEVDPPGREPPAAPGAPFSAAQPPARLRYRGKEPAALQLGIQILKASLSHLFAAIYFY